MIWCNLMGHLSGQEWEDTVRTSSNELFLRRGLIQDLQCNYIKVLRGCLKILAADVHVLYVVLSSQSRVSHM